MVVRSGAACASGTAAAAVKARSNAERIMDRAPAVVDEVRRRAPDVPEIIVGFVSRQKSGVSVPQARSMRTCAAQTTHWFAAISQTAALSSDGLARRRR